MATIFWKGDVLPVAQVNTWTFSGTWAAVDIITVTIGSKALNTVTGSTVIATFITTVVTALNASTDNEFREITWTGTATTIVGTADTKGKPFTATFTENNVGVISSPTGTATVACSGPNWADVAGNYVGGVAPTAADTLVFADSDVDVLYGLDISGFGTLAATYYDASYTGKIGLPLYNEDGDYFEYRTRHLKIQSTLVYVGQGTGAGSGRILHNGSTIATTLVIGGTGRPEAEDPAFQYTGTNATAISVSKGSVGIGYSIGSGTTAATGTVTTLNVGYVTNKDGDSEVYCGLGATLTTVNQIGGTLETRAAFTTLNMRGGECTHIAGALTTANVDSGSLKYRSSGTLTTLVLGKDAIGDFREDPQARTVTNLEMHAGSELHDPAGTVTVTNGIDLYRCSLNEVVLNVVPHRTWTPTTI